MSRPEIPTPIKHAIMRRADDGCERCHVKPPEEIYFCFAHHPPWRETKRHREDELFHLCGECHLEWDNLYRKGDRDIQAWLKTPRTAPRRGTVPEYYRRYYETGAGPE